MDLQVIGKQLAKGVKTQADLKVILESALNAELESHLGYEKNNTLRAPATSPPISIGGWAGKRQNPRF